MRFIESGEQLRRRNVGENARTLTKIFMAVSIGKKSFLPPREDDRLFVPATLAAFVTFTQFVVARSKFCSSAKPVELVGHKSNTVLVCVS